MDDSVNEPAQYFQLVMNLTAANWEGGFSVDKVGEGYGQLLLQEYGQVWELN